MKLTAPPPPTPGPPPPGDPPGGEVPPGPDAAAPEPPPDLPPLPPPPPPAARPAVWPQWFGAADTAIALLAVGLAFLVASFAARNSDLWLHLAAGRMLTTGEYSPGSDPFSFTGADRPWVNHAWLFDLGAYLLYRGDGFVLVLVKALSVAAAVGLLLGIRRPAHALWPWAAVAVVAALAAGPRLTFTPLVASFFFLAVTLFLVFRVPSPPGSWRLPVGIGITFWLWANTDAWFFVGPLALALLLIGELVRTKGLNADGPATPPDDPLGPFPDTLTLAKSLGVGVLACMLNPHHVRVWDLPYELIGGSGTDDPRLASLLMSPMTAQYWQSEYIGGNWNGLAYGLLLLGGIYAVLVTAIVGRFVDKPWDVEPLPLPHTLLWCGFAALSLKSIYAVPFLAAVSVPLLASRLNAFSARVTLGSLDDTRTRLALTLSTLGRVVSLLAIVALGACAWPGWLHPPVTYPAFARRVAWEVVPDPSLARAAARFGEWRTAGLLGPDDRGFVGSIDLANYIAWYAPGEKVFANGRFAHHRPEWAAFVRARQGLGVVRATEAADLRDAAAVFAAHKVTYAAVSASAGDASQTRALMKEAALRMWATPERWAAWYLDGRTAVSGWRPGPEATPPTFEKLRVNVVAMAFGPDAKKLPAGPVEPVPPPRVWLDDFTRPVRPAPPGADEALAWLDYNNIAAEEFRRTVFQAATLLSRLAPASTFQAAPGVVAHEYAEGQARAATRPFTLPPEGTLEAVPILAVKAARRAIADNPDHPEGYFALGMALSVPALPINEGERSLGMVSALRQALRRYPEPDAFVPSEYVTSPSQAARNLASLYVGAQLQPGLFRGMPVAVGGVQELVGERLIVMGNQVARVPLMSSQQLPADARVVSGACLFPLDLAHDTISLAGKYADRETRSATGDPRIRDAREQMLKQYKSQTDSLKAVREKATEKLRGITARDKSLRVRFEGCIQCQLIGAAIELVREADDADISREFGDSRSLLYMRYLALEIAVGNVESATANVDGLRALLGQGVKELEAASAAETDQGKRQQLKAKLGDQVQYLSLLPALELQVLTQTGDYAKAGALWEGMAGSVVTAPPLRVPTDVILRHGWPAVPVVPSPNAAVTAAVLYPESANLFELFRQQFLVRQDREAAFFFRRGYLALLEGEIEGARVRFRESRRPAIPAWDIPDITPPATRGYLRLIEAADRK